MGILNIDEHILQKFLTEQCYLNPRYSDNIENLLVAFNAFCIHQEYSSQVMSLGQFREALLDMPELISRDSIVFGIWLVTHWSSILMSNFYRSLSVMALCPWFLEVMHLILYQA